MATRGMEGARRRTAQLVGQITGVMSERTVQEILIIGAGYASTMTPVDTSLLINSQYREVTQGAHGVNGRVGYTAAYAAAVHAASGKLRGMPRPKNRGTYWAPGGEPEFLTQGFESPEARSDIEAAVRRGMAL